MFSIKYRNLYIIIFYNHCTSGGKVTLQPQWWKSLSYRHKFLLNMRERDAWNKAVAKFCEIQMNFTHWKMLELLFSATHWGNRYSTVPNLVVIVAPKNRIEATNWWTTYDPPFQTRKSWLLCAALWTTFWGSRGKIFGIFSLRLCDAYAHFLLRNSSFWDPSWCAYFTTKALCMTPRSIIK
jgi:hypothetical protein